MDVRTALLTLLDQVDYTTGACSLTEMVGAVLPKEVIQLCRDALKSDKAKSFKDAFTEGYEQGFYDGERFDDPETTKAWENSEARKSI